MKPFVRWLLAIVVLLILIATSRADQKKVHVPTLSAVPPELESTCGSKRSELQTKFNNLKQASAGKTSKEERDALASQVQVWAEEANAFNNNVATLERLLQLKPKLEAQLAKVQKWIADGKRDQAEFEKIRKDAEIDIVDDILKHVPAGAAFKKLEELKYLSSAQAKTLELGYDALTDSLSAAQALSSNDDAEKMAKILDARKTIRDAMIKSAGNLDPKAQKWLENIEKVFDSAAKTVATGLKGEKADKVTAGTVTDRLTAVGKALVDAGTTIYPPAELIVGVDAVSEKVYQRVVIMPALDSLKEATAAEFKAEHFLRSRITQIDAQIAAAKAGCQ